MVKDEVGLAELQGVLGSAGLVLLMQEQYQTAITAVEVHGGGGVWLREGCPDEEILGEVLFQHREASLPSEGARKALVATPQPPAGGVLVAMLEPSAAIYAC